MIQIFLIQILRVFRERPAFLVLPYLVQLRYIIAHLLDVESGVNSISPNVVHPTYKKNIQLTIIDKYFRFSPFILIFLIMFKYTVHPRLDPKSTVEFILSV